MASHFKQTDDQQSSANNAARSAETNASSQTNRSSSSAYSGQASGQQQRRQTTSRTGEAASQQQRQQQSARSGQTAYQQQAGYQQQRQQQAAPQDIPTTAVGFIPVISEPEDDRDAHGRRRRNSEKRNNRRREKNFRKTDPYDISGRRSNSTWRKVRRVIGRILSVLLFVVGVLLIVCGVGLWIYTEYQYDMQDEINEELAEYAVVSDDTEDPTAPEVDWDALKAVNSDVVAWIQIPGTVINYPVYQSDDNEYYLYTNAEGEYSIGGQIFLDYANTAPGLVDYQSIIYGHHLRSGSMFKIIDDMDDQEMFDSVTTVWYVTEDATYQLTPLLLYKTEEDDESAREFTFDSTEDFQAYLSELLDQAETSADNAEELISSAEQVLTLCTCNYDDIFDDGEGRTLLVCVVTSVTYSEDGSTDETTESTDTESTDESTEESADASSDESSSEDDSSESDE